MNSWSLWIIILTKPLNKRINSNDEYSHSLQFLQFGQNQMQFFALIKDKFIIRL